MKNILSWAKYNDFPILKFSLWIIGIIFSINLAPTINIHQMFYLFSNLSAIKYLIFLTISLGITGVYSYIMPTKLNNLMAKFKFSPTYFYITQKFNTYNITLISIIKNKLFMSCKNCDKEECFNVNLVNLLIMELLLLTYIFYSFGLNIPILIIAVLFIISKIISTIANMRSDFGILELTILITFSTNISYIEKLTTSLITYRVVYSLIPMVTNFICQQYKTNVDKIQKFISLHQYTTFKLFFSYIFFIIITILYLPKLFLDSSFHKFILFTIGLCMVFLTKGIVHKVKCSYYITLTLLILYIALNLFSGSTLTKIALNLILFLFLATSKNLFYRKNNKFTLKIFGQYILLNLVLSMGYLIVFLMFQAEYKNFISTQEFILSTILIIIASFIATITQLQKLNFIPPTKDELHQLEVLLNNYGGNCTSHLIFLNDKMLFFTKNKEVCIVFRPYNNKLIALSDPIGNTLQFKNAINEFRLYAKNFNMTPVFYQINEKYLSIYHENGFNFLKLGEEATLHLSEFTLAGKKGASLRTIKNKMNRGEFDFDIIHPPFNKNVTQNLRLVSDKWLDGRNEKRFSLGSFDINYLNLSPICTIQKDGELLAFATLIPTYEKGKVAVDLMRVIPEPPNGTMDALFIGIIEWSIQNNYTHFILGKAPLSNVGEQHFAIFQEKIVKYFYMYGNKIYSFIGLRRFKEKFHPTWEGIYVAYPKNTNIYITIIQISKLISNKQK
ncbi:MAG: hypothetical protein ATN36_02450 [Epulopiscium sp. Nele67-Bin005]|nr:MAG: hypothetical protein ATN36_02450 [Epulopiscium sp. Nele67-Bin005]